MAKNIIKLITAAYAALSFMGCEGRTEKPLPEGYKQFSVLMDQKCQLVDEFRRECNAQIDSRQENSRILEDIVDKRDNVIEDSKKTGYRIRQEKWSCFFRENQADFKGNFYSKGPHYMRETDRDWIPMTFYCRQSEAKKSKQ